MEMREIKEKKGKTILRFSVPSIIAMLLQTVITMTDGYFTGNYVGEHALAAINLGLPILYVFLGIVLLLAFLLIFPAIWGMTGVWMAAPATEAVTAMVSAVLIGRQKRRIEGR